MPIVFKGNIEEAIEFVKSKQLSQCSEKERLAEGIVITEENGLRDRLGERIIFKVKEKDFRWLLELEKKL